MAYEKADDAAMPNVPPWHHGREPGWRARLCSDLLADGEHLQNLSPGFRTALRGGVNRADTPAFEMPCRPYWPVPGSAAPFAVRRRETLGPD